MLYSCGPYGRVSLFFDEDGVVQMELGYLTVWALDTFTRS